MKRQYNFIPVLVLFTLFAILLQPAYAKVKLPRLVSNGMILQRDIPVQIWGWANPSEKVKIEFHGESYKTKADTKGNWSIELPAIPAGGPYTMNVNDIELKNIMFGEVWLSSGQSNMELPIRRVMDLYADEINKVNNPNIRLFRSSTRKEPETAQLDYPDGVWLPATQENIGEFSAISWFFANNLYQKYQVPIGIISTAIGGSPAEAWLSKDKVSPYLKQWKAQKAHSDSVRTLIKQETPEKLKYNWHKEVNKNDTGVARWSKADVDVSSWSLISIPGYWTDKGVELHNGSIWFYKAFELPDSLVDQDAILRMGRIIDSDSAFINGVFVGSTSYQYPPRIYTVPKSVLKPSKNIVMMRVFSQGWRGGFVEEKPYELRVGKQKIDLTGEWNYHIGATLNPPWIPGNPGFMPGGLFNSLISPALNYTVNGVIWYQGETNGGQGKAYLPLFKGLILDWRKNFAQPNMPFLFVQLANLGRPSKQPVENGWADLRDSQRRTLVLPHTGMAVAVDLGEWNDIHPLNKKEVARRLFLEAKRVAYGDTTIVSSGPLYESMKLENECIIIKFKSVGKGLYANSLLEGFQIAGDDGQFVWANAVVLSKNKVKVWSRNIKNPTAVRYAWEMNPVGANLKNKEGLPASPFTTEKRFN